MNTAQRIVKYFAFAFAIFLTVSIFSAIVYGILGIATAGRLIEDNSTAAANKCEGEEKLCLEVALSISNLEIKKGDDLYVETKNEKVEVSKDEHKLVVTERGRHFFESYNDREVIIYIPENMEFEKVAISGGAGNLYVESLRAKNIEMSLGIGKTEINALETDNADISTGIGEVSVKLISKAEAYEIKASKGIGDITLNGKSIPEDKAQGSGSKKIEISGGIGAIKITTAEE